MSTISRISACGMTQAGTSRGVNEDSFQLGGSIYPDTLNQREQKIYACDDYWQLYSITDGLGGAGVGDIASRVTQSFLTELGQNLSMLDPLHFDFPGYMQDFLNQADLALQERLKRMGSRPAGCSLALALFAGDTCYTMSIGSCRIYLYRRGNLYRMSEDQVLVDTKEVRPLLFLGNHPGIYQLKAQNLKRLQLMAEDQIFLLSDGLTGAVPDEDMQWVLDRPSSLRTYVESIFLKGRRQDGRDNQTILGLKVESLRIFADDSYREIRSGHEPHRPSPALGQTLPFQRTDRTGSATASPNLGNTRIRLPYYVADIDGEAAETPVVTEEYQISQLAMQATQATRPFSPVDLAVTGPVHPELMTDYSRQARPHRPSRSPVFDETEKTDWRQNLPLIIAGCVLIGLLCLLLFLL